MLTVAIVTTQDVTVEDDRESITFNVRITGITPAGGFNQGSPTVGIEYSTDEIHRAGINRSCGGFAITGSKHVRVQ